MPRQDTVDFLAAFAVGTVLGIGATLLLQPERTPTQRLARQWKPYRKRVGKGLRNTREALRDSADATGDMTGDVVSAGRELLGEFRKEVGKILDDARDEVQDMTQRQGKDLSKSLRKARRKFGV
jgi:gas vesicle protein